MLFFSFLHLTHIYLLFGGLNNNDRGSINGVLLGSSSFYSVNGYYDYFVASTEYIGFGG